MMRLINLLFSVLAVSSLPINAAAQVIEIPIWKDIDGRVRVHLNFDGGGTFDFIVDTGAMKSFITPALVEALDLHQIPAADAKPTDLMMGFTPYASQDVMVGGLVAFTLDRPGSLRKMTISAETVYGVLGEDFLGSYAAEFDLENNAMRLAESADALKGHRTFDRTGLGQLFPGMGLLSVQVEVAGRSVRAFLDTGAGKTMINQNLYELIRDEHVVRAGESKTLRGSHGPAQVATSVILDAVSLGTRTWTEAEVLVADGIFSQLRMTDGPAILLGANLLHDGRVFIIDYPGMVFWMESSKL